MNVFSEPVRVMCVPPYDPEWPNTKRSVMKRQRGSTFCASAAFAQKLRRDQLCAARTVVNGDGLSLRVSQAMMPAHAYAPGSFGVGTFALTVSLPSTRPREER